MAKQANTAPQQAPVAAPVTAPVCVWFVGSPQATAILAKGGTTARYRSVALAQQYHGKPVVDFQAAWLAAAQTGGIHHAGSVFTKGISKTKAAHQAYSGWQSYLTGKRSGSCVVLAPVAPPAK